MVRITLVRISCLSYNDRPINVRNVYVSVNTDQNPNVGPETLLVDFIRDVACLKGTKFMCREGGCGACAVSGKRLMIWS